MHNLQSFIPRSPYQVEFVRHGDNFEFIVTQLSREIVWHSSLEFSKDHHGNWGLWDFDVVELFLELPTATGEKGYWELQCSTLGQLFYLHVEKPRELYFSPLKREWSVTNILKQNQWVCQIHIPNCPENVRGNAHAILGGDRFHFSLNPNSGNPDFHIPQNFVDL